MAETLKSCLIFDEGQTKIRNKVIVAGKFRVLIKKASRDQPSFLSSTVPETITCDGEERLKYVDGIISSGVTYFDCRSCRRGVHLVFG